MNTVRPRPYPQRGTGYNAGNDATDKDGHNSNGQQQQGQQGQNPQVIARGRANEVQQPPIQPRAAINSPANNAYPQAQGYRSQIQPMPMMPTRQINPMQYQAMQAQAGYQAIPQHNEPIAQQTASPKRSNKVNIAQILKDFRNNFFCLYKLFF